MSKYTIGIDLGGTSMTAGIVSRPGSQSVS